MELYPARKRLRVRGLHSGGKQIERAVAGQRTAVNLAGIEHEEITRGMVLAPAGLFEATQRVDARITLLGSAPPLKNRARVHFHQGTAEAIAEVILLNDGGGELAAGGSAFAQLRLDKPSAAASRRSLHLAAVFAGGDDRRRHGAGRSRAAAQTQRCRGRADFLDVLEHGTREEILCARWWTPQPRGMTMAEIVARTGWIESETRAAAEKLAIAKRVRILGGAPIVVAPAKAVTEYAAAIRKAVEAFHRANPLLPGIPKQELRARAGRARVEIFDAALGDLVVTRALVVTGDLVAPSRARNFAFDRRNSRKGIDRARIRKRRADRAGICQRAGEAAGGRAARAENSADSAARKSAGEDLQRPGLSPQYAAEACAKCWQNTARNAARACRSLYSRSLRASRASTRFRY